MNSTQLGVSNERAPRKFKKPIQPNMPIKIQEKEEPPKILTDETREALDVLQANKNLQKLEEKTMVKDKELWIPIERMPSNNKVYDSNNSVEYKRYDYGDFEYLNNADILPAQRYKLMLKGIRCKNLSNILLLPYYDFTSACFVRKLEALGGDREFAIPYRCDKCGQVGTHSFKLSEVELNELEIDLPIKVRFMSHPDEIFEFGLHTIGDVIFLMEEDLFFAKKDNEYILDLTGSPIPDRVATLAASCISHPFEYAYDKLHTISNERDYNIINKVYDMLRYGIKEINFTCKLSLPKEKDDDKIEQENKEKLAQISEWNGELPPLLRLAKERQNQCGHKISLEVLGGGLIFLPFRESTLDIEYGILP